MEIKSYDLSIDLDFSGLAYSAQEKVHVLDSDGNLSLDSVELEIEAVKANGEHVDFHSQREKLVLSSLPKGELILEIKYSGRVNQQNLHGFYASKYGDSYVISTDFEPSDARTFFPCLDDPKFKAEFSLHVSADKGLTVISNTPISTTSDLPDGRQRTDFERTPKMSTYLFYLGIGRFDQSSKQFGNKEVFAATTPGQIGKAKIPLDNALKYLERFEEYYKTPYPLDKLHLIALPEYAAGAMENWGAITFREVALFVDDSASIVNKRRATKVLGHEIAHQWFGDLVTMKWWDDLWLNESFATFMEAKATDFLFPEWKTWDEFLKEEYAGAMRGDALENTHSVVVSVEDPHTIDQIFDEISYGKGASVLRMIEAYLGEENFREGVARYLSRYKYSNAEGKDLWSCLEESSNVSVSKIMESWLSKPGYPLVEISTLNGSTLSLKHGRFLLNPGSKSGKEESWPVPMSISINGEIRKFVLGNREEKISIDGVGIRLVKANVGQTGFYKVLYDNPLYILLEREFVSLNVHDKWGIIEDLFSFVLANRADLDLYLTFAGKCFSEDQYLLASTVADQLDLLRFIAPKNEKVARAFRDHYGTQIKRLGFSAIENEKEEDKILRGRIALGLAMNDDQVAQELSERFLEFGKSDPNLKTAVAVAYARTLGEKGYESLVKAAKEAESEADLIKIFWGLTSFKEPELVMKGLDFTIGGDVSRADCIYAIGAAAYNRDASEGVWSWTKASFGKVLDIFRGSAGSVALVLDDLISHVGLDRETEVREYFSNARLPGAERGIRKGLELLEIYSGLKKRLDN